jgi:hypothetical protein
MRVLAAIGLLILFAIGAVFGLAIGLVIFPTSLVRGARAVHAEGVVCRAEIVAQDPAGQRLVGPALVRLSGAFGGQATWRPSSAPATCGSPRPPTGTRSASCCSRR